jgi:hypothetical protein
VQGIAGGTPAAKDYFSLVDEVVRLLVEAAK